MSAPQFLFAARDNFNGQSYQLTDPPGTAAIQSAVTITPAGMTLQLAAGMAQYFSAIGDNYYWLGSGGNQILGRVTACNTTTNVVNYLPVNDIETWPILQNANQTMPAGSILQQLGYQIVELPIDLSEAEPGNYKYVILARGHFMDFGAAAPIRMWVSSNTRPGNPVNTGWALMAHERVTVGNGVHQGYFSAHSFTVRGGDVRCAALLGSTYPGAGQPNASAMGTGALAAIRVDNCPVFVEASGANFVGSGAEQTLLSVTLPEAGDYLFIGSSTCGGTAESVAPVVRLGRYTAANADIELFNAYFYLPMNTPVAAGDRRTFGLMRYRVGCAAGETFRLKIDAGANARIDYGYIAAFKLPPGMLAVGAALSSGMPTITTTPAQIASASVTLPKTGRYLECSEFQVTQPTGGGGTVQTRHRFTGDPASYYAGTGIPRGAQYHQTDRGFLYSPGTFFMRSKREAGAAAHYIDAWCASATATFVTYKGEYTALYFEDLPKVSDDQVVTAKVETAHWFRRWETEQWPDSFGRNFPKGTRVSRVIVNGTELTQVVGPLTAPNLWYYVEPTGRLMIRLGSGQSPADTNMVVLVCLWLYAATEPVSLLEPPWAGDPVERAQPYHARLMDEPDFSQEVSADGTGINSSSTLGTVELAAVDGVFDPDIRLRRVEGLRTIVRRGSKSDLRETKHRVQLVATNGGHVLDDKLSVRLYSSLVELTRPVTELTMTVIQNGFSRTGISIPILLGAMNRIPAYLQNWNIGAANSSTYRLTAAEYGLESIGALYYTPNENNAHNVPGVINDPVNGIYTVPNTGFADPNAPPDVVYFQAFGTRAIPGNSSSRTLRLPGEMARTILRIGNVPLDRIDEQSFIDFDRLWRRRITGGVPVPLGPSCAVYIDQSMSIGDAVSKVLSQAFGMRTESPAGRVAAAVMDFTAYQLATNSGFEGASNNVWPWDLTGNGTAAVTTLPVFEGTRAGEISNGTNPATGIFQAVTIRKPRFVVAVTALAALRTGLTDYVRLAFVRPGEGFAPQLSEPIHIESTAWTRLSHWLQLDEDEVGTVVVVLYPTYGQTASTSVLFDNVEVWPVAVVSRNRATALLSEEDEEQYYQARVEWTTNSYNEINPAIILTDGDLAGASQSFAKFATPGSGRADFGSETRHTNLDSASGVAAAILRYFAVPRFKLRTTELLGPSWRRPGVNDILLDDSQYRKVMSADRSPIYSIRRVSTGKSPRVVDIEAEQRGTLVSDSLAISPQKIPLGLIGLSVDGTCPTDWVEYTDLANYYLTGGTPGTYYGAWRHTHTLSHTHPMGGHAHNVTGLTTGAIDEYANTCPTIGPVRGVSRSDHAHGVASGTWATGGMTGSPTSTIANATTIPSGNVLSCMWIKLCKRTGNTVDTAPTNIAFFSESATAPGGFTRATELDGKTFKVTTNLPAVSTTTTAAHTPGTSSATFVVASAANIAVGRILKLTSGANNYSCYVTSVAGTTITVDVLNLDGETVGVNYASGATVTSGATTAGTSETWGQHRHGGTVDPHTHQETHGHAVGATNVTIPNIPGQPTTNSTNISGGTTQMTLSPEPHDHQGEISIPDATTQTSASAGGTLNASSLPTPDTIALPWHKALAGTLQVAAGLGAFVDGAICPPGWVEYTAGNGRIVKGAAAGAGVALVSGTHNHPATFAAHAVSHNHGGSVSGVKTTQGFHFGPGYSYPDSGYHLGAYGGSMDLRYRSHAHALSLSGVSTVAGSLAQVTGLTSDAAGGATMPPSRALRMCVKG